MKNRISTFYWKLFFSGYWTAYDLGEKEDPQINAAWFIILNFELYSCSILLFISAFKNEKLPFAKLLFFLAFIIPAIINLFLLFNKKSGYKKQLKNYHFLSAPENKKTRLKYMIFTILSSFLFMIICALLNNSSIKNLLTF